MPQVQSRDFGILEYPPESVISFPHGLPGFEDEHAFVFIEPAALAPAVVLQSVETPDLSFLTVPVSTMDANYQIGIVREDLQLLGLDDTRQPPDGDKVRCVAIVSVRESGGLTANLLAPVVVNLDTRIGVQAVRNDATYSHCHPIGTGAGEPPC